MDAQPPTTQPVSGSPAFCPNCGKPKSEGEFCTFCGASLAPGGPPEVQPTTARGISRSLILGGIAALLGLGVVGFIVLRGAGLPGVGDTHTIHGLFAMSNSYTLNGGCGGYVGTSSEGLHSGDQVKLTDDAGKVVAVGTLKVASYDTASEICTMSFDLPDVPKAAFYSISIGIKNGPTYTYDELVQSKWSITVNI